MLKLSSILRCRFNVSLQYDIFLRKLYLWTALDPYDGVLLNIGCDMLRHLQSADDNSAQM